MKKLNAQIIVSGNPHAFDAGTISGNLLYRLIQRMNKDRQIVLPENKVFPSLQRHRCYLSVGLMLDQVSNYMMFYGISARKKEGTVHAGIEGFLQEREMVQIPLVVLAKCEKILSLVVSVESLSIKTISYSYCGRFF